MKNIFEYPLKVLSAFLVFIIISQDIAAQHTAPSPYSNNIAVNFIRSWDALAPEQDPSLLPNRQLKDVKMTTQYFDGLGRPLQTVQKEASMKTGSAASDMVMAVEYDGLGREQYKWLPFASSENTGAFKTDPFIQQAVFYNDPNGPLKGQGESYFYSQMIFEASPLSRVNKAMAPGISWVGSNRGVEQKYWLNTALDSVKSWSVADVSGSFGNYSLSTANNGIYNANELFKNISVDEHGRQVSEFKDKEGKVILKKVQINTLTGAADDGTGRGYYGWLCTYYIYDNMGQLRCVIQPEAVKMMATTNNWVLSSTQLNEQCFRYVYDSRGRVSVKKAPGSAAVNMVYDQRDRLVMKQDGNLSAEGKWIVTLYDNLNRPVQTGLWTNSNTHAYHVTQAAGSNNFYYPFDAATIPATGWDKLTSNHYDNYSGLPSPLTSSFNNSWTSYFQPASNNSYPYPQALTATTITAGLSTWTETKILNSNQYLLSVLIYDEKGRVIQVQSTNITGGVDISTTQYNWAGQPLVTVQKQEKAGSVNPQITVVVTKLSYDDLGRVSKVEKKVGNNLVNNGAMPETFKTIAVNEYDKLGQLKTKRIGTKPNTATALESLTYDHNIRGWMLGANRDYAKDANSSNYFGFDLGYDKANNGIMGNQAYLNSQYNGNISGMVWKSKGDGEKRKYDFGYDAANRMMKADFTQYTGTTFNQTAGINYDVKMGDNGIDVSSAYDDNGNIKRMQQWGWKLTGSVPIDNLEYAYQVGSNKLAKVTDAVLGDNKLGDFKDGTNGSTDDYAYDVNGNMHVDNNKAISNITYNYLNIPAIITVPGKGNITYIYDAAGNKMKKQTIDNATTGKTISTTTTYIGGMVYESKTTVPANSPNDDYTDRLLFIGHEEGRIRFKPAAGSIEAGFQYDYMLKDHLGNVRMVLTEEVQQDRYPATTLENVTYNGGTAISIESQYYNIDNSKIVNQSAATGIPTYQNNNAITNNNPYSNTAANSARLYRLNAVLNTVQNKNGLGIILKVMAGDAINIWGKSYHKKPASGYTLTTNPISVLDLMTLLAVSPAVSGKGITGSQIAGLPGFPTNVTSLLNNQPPQNTNMPRASVNWVILDEQFKYVSGGFDMVGTANNTNGTFKNHTITGIAIPKNGYIYVYCSNESQYNVFFDNVQVIHDRGPILEETHYYPFGLVMAGISNKAAGTIQNKEKTFQEQRFDDDLGVNYIQFKYRSHDPQIGRFIQIDPLSHDYRHNSTYAFSENRVTDGRELEGLEYISIHHYANGTNGIKSHYKSTDAEINKINGTTAGVYNSASYGPQGKGVVHYYYDDQGALNSNSTIWDQRQTGGNSDVAYHGLYSGPGCITKDGGEKSTNYDFIFQPIDWSDAIAKRHDMDYAAATATGEKYAGFLEDVRTVQADRDMVQRINNYTNPFKKVEGVETPFRTSWSGEMELSMKGQSVVISALATYKQWKIDNNYGNIHTYDKLREDFRKDNKAVAFIIDKIVNR